MACLTSNGVSASSGDRKVWNLSDRNASGGSAQISSSPRKFCLRTTWVARRMQYFSALNRVLGHTRRCTQRPKVVPPPNPPASFPLHPKSLSADGTSKHGRRCNHVPTLRYHAQCCSLTQALAGEVCFWRFLMYCSRGTALCSSGTASLVLEGEQAVVSAMRGPHSSRKP